MLVLLLSITVFTIIIPIDGGYKGSSTPDKRWESTNIIHQGELANMSPHQGSRSLKGLSFRSGAQRAKGKGGKSKQGGAKGTDYDDEAQNDEADNPDNEDQSIGSDEDIDQGKPDERNDQDDKMGSEEKNADEDEDNPDEEGEKKTRGMTDKDPDDGPMTDQEHKPRVVLVVPVPKGRGKEMATKEGMIKYLGEIFPDTFGDL